MSAERFNDPALLVDTRVALTRMAPAYEDGAEIADALARVCERLGWASASGGPFGALVPDGGRVLVKPNWVVHRNAGRGGFEPLVTHATVLQGIVRALRSTSAARITVGDAPVQGCDFDELLSASGMGGWMTRERQADGRVHGPVDFRRTVSSVEGAVRVAQENVRSLDEYVLFDLGADSYLEPVTSRAGDFRVTMYPPDLMARTHAPGRHQYLVAREVIEANVIINAPKLKTHKKAGVTCALKNLVGINGNKEYLPHHRVGSPTRQGDCYPEEGPAQSSVKRTLEHVLDVRNSTNRAAMHRALGVAARVLQGVSHRLGDRVGVEGAWSGNDTVWRMCLDLNRIILYGTLDGTIAAAPQRRVVNIVDAIIAGQGDGPLAPDALALGVLYASPTSAAADWVGSLLLNYDPLLIPITREAFGATPWPLVRFPSRDVVVLGDDGMVSESALVGIGAEAAITHPEGWRDAVRPAADRAAV